MRQKGKSSPSEKLLLRSPKIFQIPIKPCPWCGHGPILENPHHEETWKWRIRCENKNCDVSPVGKHVNVRKKQRGNIPKMIAKVVDLAIAWNVCPGPVTHALLINIDEWREIMMNVLGRQRSLGPQRRIDQSCLDAEWDTQQFADEIE